MGTSSMSIHGGSSFPGQVYCHAGRGEIFDQGRSSLRRLFATWHGEIWTDMDREGGPEPGNSKIVSLDVPSIYRLGRF